MGKALDELILANKKLLDFMTEHKILEKRTKVEYVKKIQYEDCMKESGRIK